MSDMQELGTLAGGVGGAGEAPAPSTLDQPGVERQPAQGTQAQDTGGQWTGNLDDLPQFREVKSKYDKTTAALQKQLEQLSQQRQADQQRQQQLEEMLERLQTQGMDEPQRQAYEFQKLQRINQALMQQMGTLRNDNVKQQALRAMQQKAKSYGIDVSIDELYDQPDADTAWEFVLQKGASSWSNAAQQRQQKQEANAPFLGGGSGGNSGQTDLQTRYDQAVAKNDAMKMLDIMYEAERGGYDLKL